MGMDAGLPVRKASLQPQIQPAEEGAGVTRRRSRGTSPVELQSLPFNDDMLREILIRLPPQPSSLPRASAVCRRWRRLVTDPKFHRQFRAHHRKPPLLGAFMYSDQQPRLEIVFTPFLDPPDRIAPTRFDLGRCSNGEDYSMLDCRHGLLIIQESVRNEIIVCDPITGEQRLVSFPLEFKSGYVNGACVNAAILCAAGGLAHLHGGCQLSSYKVVLVSTGRSDNQPLACVYSLETGVCGDIISTEAPCELLYSGSPPTLVGNVLYWLFESDRILEFDLGRQNLAVTVGPPVTNEFSHGDRQIILAEDGDVGFAILANPRFQMWQRKVSCQGVATWVPWKTIEMNNILGLSLQIGEKRRWLLGYDEDNDVIFVWVSNNVYAVQLKSTESKKIYETSCVNQILPYTSFYAPGTSIDGGSDGAEMLHGT